MKIDFKKFLKINRKIDLRHKNCISPHKGWKTLVWIVVFSGFLLIIFSLYLFFNIKNEKFFQVKVEENTNIVAVDQNKLDKIIKEFDVKKENTQKLLNGEVNFKDPS